MSEDLVLEIPPIIRSVSPPGSRHPSPEERMEFVKWYMTDEVQDLYKNKPRYKVRKMVIKMYLDEFGIKISEPFLVGLDEGELTRETVEGEIRYSLAKKFKTKNGDIVQVSLNDYCKNPNIFLRIMQSLKK